MFKVAMIINIFILKFMKNKISFTLNVTFLLSSTFGQNVIGEGLTGVELLDYVVSNYKTTTTLGYNTARDTLYGVIDLKDDNQLSCVYSGYSITIDTLLDPSTNAFNQGINCEHTWPQSMGAHEEPQKSDLHHLFPCKSNVNSSRGNHPYADIIDEETDVWYRDDYSQETMPESLIDEYAEKLNGQEPLFEPREKHKGDAARAMFYFFSIYNENADTSFWNAQKDILLEWHSSDTVDNNELERTWKIAVYQENHPNPFILDSSLARRIWFMENMNENNSPNDFFLISPNDSSVFETLNPSFLWEESVDNDYLDSVSYTLVLDNQNPGIEYYLVGADTSFFIINPLQDNSQYFWQIIAEDMNANQTVCQNGFQTFFINTENDPPSLSLLVAPLDGSIQTDLSPNMYWTESHDPDPMDHVSYLMSIWDMTDILSIELDSNGVTLETDLMDNNHYMWTVKSIDMNGAETSSDTAYFYTDAFPEPPLNFMTLFPENNAAGVGTEVQFVWNATTDPDPIETIHYQLIYTDNWEDSTTYLFSELLEDTTLTVILEDNSQYYWGVVAIDSDGFMIGSNDNTPNTLVVGTLSIDEDLIPEVFALHQNYPNPFNPTTNINYDLLEDALVTINIYDLMGRSIKSLVNNNQSAGYRSVRWNATNNLGETVSAGMYICTIQAGAFKATKKMVLLK